MSGISAFCCVTKPEERQDPWRESIASVLSWADEVVVVCGHKDDEALIKGTFKEDKVRCVYLEWPEEFGWEELPKHLNLGLSECKGDWAVRFDADYVFEDNRNFPDGIRREFEKRLFDENKNKVAVTFQKMSAVLSTRFYSKASPELGINKREFPQIAFGLATDHYTDLCVPIMPGNGKQKGIPVGETVSFLGVGRTGIYIYNYDYTFKTLEFTKKEFLRFSLAHQKFFGWTHWGTTEGTSFEKFLEQMSGRLKKCTHDLSYERQPLFIQEKIKAISEDCFGYNGWGLLES